MFCTAVNCMDGRVQLPVIDYLKKRFHTTHVDVITEAGPVLILAQQQGSEVCDSILRRIAVSTVAHHSTGIAIVAHHDCAGNPVSEQQQLDHLQDAYDYLVQECGTLEVVGLWVDASWTVSELFCSAPGTQSDPEKQ